MSPRTKVNAKDRIMATAYDLFYRQGYQATTMDQIIEQSGLSKPTIYAHFPTKQELCVSYLKERHRREGALLKQKIDGAKTPEEEFLSIIRFVRENMIASKFRGCGFFNVVSEIPDRKSPIVKEAMGYVDAVRELIRKATETLRNSDPKYAGIDVQRLSETYYVMTCGAIMACQEMLETWPLDRAVEEVERLLENNTSSG